MVEYKKWLVFEFFHVIFRMSTNLNLKNEGEYLIVLVHKCPWFLVGIFGKSNDF